MYIYIDRLPESWTVCRFFSVVQLNEYVSDLVEVHGIVQSNNSIACHNYVLFDKEASQNFGKYLGHLPLSALVPPLKI